MKKKTKIFSIRELKEASEFIKEGKVVVFPTETVYGIGANIFNKKAVKKIFSIKKRPRDNPLIVHISSSEEVKNLAKIPKEREEEIVKLMKNFWPGPLTIILKKQKHILDEVTSGLDTVAIRMPKDKIALKFLQSCNSPIGAPSANISQKPSTTRFEDAFDDLNGRVDGIIKAKNSQIGLESTVVDLTVKPAVILRPGSISYEKLKKVIPDIEKNTNENSNKSPGVKYKHYSPKAKIILFEKDKKELFEEYKKLYEEKEKIFLSMELKKTTKFGKELYSFFRKADRENKKYILVLGTDEKGIGFALMNRVRKASWKIINK